MDTVNENNITAKVITILAAVVIFAIVLVPIVNSVTQEKIDIDQENSGNIGTNLSYSDLSAEHENKTINVTVSGTSYTLSGDTEYTGDLSVDQIVMVSDANTLFIRNGAMYFFDGSLTKEVDSTMTISISGTEVCGTDAAWVYYPDTEGKYASYTDYIYPLSDCVAVGSFAGVSLISDGDTVETASVDGFTAAVDQDDDGVHGVTYNYNEA